MPADPFVLHGRPFTGSAAVEAIFELAAQPYRVVTAETEPDGRPPTSLLALNPLGQVPVLVLPSGEVMTESGAIVIYLADLFPEAGLAPLPHSPHRPRYLRWMLFLAANTYMGHLRFYNPARYTTDPDGAAAIKHAAHLDLERQFAILAEAVGDGPWFLGDTFSALDLYAAMVIAWAEDVPALFARQPRLADHFAHVKARPRVRPVWQRHKMDF